MNTSTDDQIDYEAVVDCLHVTGTWSGRRADAIEAGVAALEAEFVESDDRYRYFAEETSTHYLVSTEDVAALGAALLSGHGMSQAYSIWCASSEAEETKLCYTYTIYDSDPNASGGGEWPHHSDVPIECDSDWEAIEEVRSILENDAVGLNIADGYAVGNKLYALVWDDQGTVIGTPTHTLTAYDLGIDEDDS